MSVRELRAGATGVTVALVGGFVVSAGIVLGSAQTPAGKTVWDGAFSAAQAVRGKAVYLAECSGCHLETLQGDGGASPALIGKDFVQAWDRKSVRDLFSRIRNTMPATNPGGLRPGLCRYYGLPAAMNRFPEGSAELPPEAEAHGGCHSTRRQSLTTFHPATARWFADALGEATVAQAGWTSIREGRHTLIGRRPDRARRRRVPDDARRSAVGKGCAARWPTRCASSTCRR
jgi:hypothetical protein